VLEVRLLARNLGQRRLATGLVELLEAVEAVAAEAEHLARVGDTAQRLRQLEQSELVANDLLILGHLTLLSNLQRGRICQIKSWLLQVTARVVGDPVNRDPSPPAAPQQSHRGENDILGTLTAP